MPRRPRRPPWLTRGVLLSLAIPVLLFAIAAATALFAGLRSGSWSDLVAASAWCACAIVLTVSGSKVHEARYDYERARRAMEVATAQLVEAARAVESGQARVSISHPN